MALHLEHGQTGPPDSRAHRWVSSPSAAGVLSLVSRKHRVVNGHGLPPVSAFSGASGLGLFDARVISSPLIPGCSVFALVPGPQSLPRIITPRGCCPARPWLALAALAATTTHMTLRSRLFSNRGGMPYAGPEHDRLHPEPYVSSAHGSIYYSPNRPAERRRRADPGNFPAPLTEPRRRRPHSIHIVSYPPGFVPRDLRPDTPNKKPTRSEKRARKKIEKKEAKQRKLQEKERRNAEKERAEKQEKRRSIRSIGSLSSSSEKVARVIDKIFAVLSIASKPSPAVSTTPVLRTPSRPTSLLNSAARLSRLQSTLEPIIVEETATEQPAMAGPVLAQPAGTSVMSVPRSSTMPILSSAKSIISSSVSEVQKPVASVSGLSCSILLAEPNVFLTGFDHDHHHTRRQGQTTSALLRGKLQLNVSKNVKIKSVTLKLVGKARTEWPEGIPPQKTELFEEQMLRTQSLVFFHAMHQGMWDTEYGSQCTYTYKSPKDSLTQNTPGGSMHILGKGRNSTLTAKELKRLSLQSVNSRSFGKGDSPHINQVQAKGYKVFCPGTYEYSFELPIDHNQPETAKLQYGSVRWELQATVERAGAFKPNLHGSKEVSIIRVPDQMSLETVEPITISRMWEDQLHYDIVISGKSFPIGGRIPIAFKLTPLAKVQVHKLKVFVTEHIEYWTNNRHVMRRDPGRKLLLLEKAAGKPVDKQFAASEIRVVSGGELEPIQRAEARVAAAHRRMRETGSSCSLPELTDNLLGDLDLGLEAFWGSTEIEMNVQLPTCEVMARDKTLRLHPDCSWKNANVHHWIKIVMRISRADPDDPTGKRRRHFEISIDSPFTILNCRATQANTALPRYNSSGGPVPEQRPQMSCGCHDAQPLDQTTSGVGPLAMTEEDITGRRLRLDTPGFPALPRAAHLQYGMRHSSAPTPSSSGAARPETAPSEPDRPIHLLRLPSHNPPAFDADEPPPPLLTPGPPLQTPPPHYDLIVGTPSVDGLADYFARLAAYEGMMRPADSETPTQPAAPIPAPACADVAKASRNGSGNSSDDSDTNTISPDARSGTSTPARPEPSTPTELVGDVDADPFEKTRMPSSTPNLAASKPSSAEAESSAQADAATTEEATVLDDDSSASDSADDEEARAHRRGRVNVANPRTPGGRLVPSRSLDIERPVLRLDMAGVVRRRGGE
ncbi:hypothetical protein VTI74DRAFT_3698 [Chaetomium olivicolor]